MNNRRRGDSFERQLASRLYDEGFFVVRSAGSGTADRPNIDLVAINENVVWLIECKTYRGEYEGHRVPFDEQQLMDVREIVDCHPGSESVDDNAVVGVAVKCVDGGIVQYCEPKTSPVITVGETRSFYKVLEEFK